MKLHDKEFLYKYVTADIATKILSNLEVLCSSPKLFNDPFDSQFLIQFDTTNEEELKERLVNSLLEKIKDRMKIKDAERARELIMQEVFKDISVSEYLNKLCNETNSLIEKEFFGDRIFCLSEVKDNLLMWAHYSDNHKGAVIQFKCLPGNYALNAAQKVIYSQKMPTLTIEELTEDYFSGKQLVVQKIIKEMLLTKSKDWEYEKEWRVILLQQNQNEEKDLRGVSQEEISAVFLGCNMPTEDEKKIKHIVKTKLKDIKLYKADKDKKEFKLNFIEIKMEDI